MEPVSALIAGGAALLGTGANVYAGGRMNKKTREWSEKMYERQKNDNIDFWNTQNTYNSPAAQMQRLKDANLNPHLAYGNGSVANTGGSISSPHYSTPDQKAPTIDLPAVVQGYFNVKQQAANINNTQKQGDILALEAEKKSLENGALAELLGYKKEYENSKRKNENLKTYALAAEHWFKTGQGTPFIPMIGDGSFGRNSFYDLQAKSMDLSNKLRGAEVKAKKQDYDINTLRKNYFNRIYSPDASSLSFKDWLQLMFQGVNAFK